MVAAAVCLILVVVWTLFAYSAIPLPVNESLFAWVRRQWLMEGTAILVFLGVLAVAWRCDRRSRSPNLPWWSAWWVWIGYAGVSCCYSIDRGLSLRAWLAFLSYGLLAYLAAGVVTTPRDLHTWVQFLVGAAVAVSVEGFFQYFGSFHDTLRLMDQLLASGQLDVRGWNVGVFRDFLVRKRIFSVFGWPNLYAGFLLLVIPMAVGLSLQARQRLVRIGWGAVTVVLSTSLLLTLSMGAWIAAVATGGAVGWLMTSGSPRTGPRAGYRPDKTVRFLLVSVVVIGVVWVTSWMAARRARPYIASSTHSRIVYLQGALNILRADPLQGTGFGTFGVSYRAFMPLERSEGQHTALHAHNTLLQIGAELGAIGLALFFMFLWRVGGLIRWGLQGRAGAHDPIRWGIATGLVAFFLHSLIEQTFFEGVTAPFSWIALGLLTGAAALAEPSLAVNPSVARHRVMHVLLPIMGGLATGVMAVRLANADVCLAVGGFQDMLGHRPEALAAFDQAQQWDPLASRYPFEKGQRLVKWAQGQPQPSRVRLLEQAAQQFERAVNVSPWLGSAWLSLGIVQEELGRPHDALSALRNAVKRDPNSRSAVLQLAQLLGQARRFEELIDVVKRYEQLEPRDAKGWFLEASAWQQLNQPDRAAGVYRQLLQRDRTNYAAWFNLAELLQQRGDSQGAAAAYRAFLEVAPMSDAIPRAQATAFLQQQGGR